MFMQRTYSWAVANWSLIMICSDSEEDRHILYTTLALLRPAGSNGFSAALLIELLRGILWSIYTIRKLVWCQCLFQEMLTSVLPLTSILPYHILTLTILSLLLPVCMGSWLQCRHFTVLPCFICSLPTLMLQFANSPGVPASLPLWHCWLDCRSDIASFTTNLKGRWLHCRFLQVCILQLGLYYREDTYL